MSHLARLFFVPTLVLVLDQLSKFWVVSSLPYGGRRSLVPGFCQLVHTTNRGVAFGLFADAGPLSQLLLLVLILALVAFVGWQLWQHRESPGLRWALGSILGGALGNLADRLLRGEVVDFLDLYVSISGRTYHWPAFNLADSAITLGALALLFLPAVKHASLSR